MTDRPTLDQLSAELPRDIAPPADLWADIRAGLEPRDAVALPRTGMAFRTRQLIAAGLVVAVASSAITALALRNRGATQQAAEAAPSRPAAPELPVVLANAEHGYTRSVDALQRTLDERRDSLAPSTVATVERSLRVADSAIAEARAALTQDPANRALAALFASNYERKIDLMRRATELAPRT
ncbi:MAG: hypothetical protein ABIY52_11575 [Gemmatimonadaceae bacterium]